MLELLEHYSVSEILTFLVLFALAFKGVVSFWDWFWNWLKSKFDKNYYEEKQEQDLSERIKWLNEITLKQQEEIDKMNKSLKLLIESDKDNIKAWIVEKHHYYCYEIKGIDYYTLEAIERRYEHYKQEDGNSYITSLVQELQALPKIEHEYLQKIIELDRQNH